MVLRDTAESLIAFAYGAITLFGWPFQATSASDTDLSLSASLTGHAGRPYNTTTATAVTYHAASGLGSSAFARHYSRNDFCSSRY